MGKKMWANWGQDAEHLKGTKWEQKNS
jgi:hypothetical protein